MTTARKPPLKPQPRPDSRATRTFASEPNPARPLTNKAMRLLQDIIDASEGKITAASLARDIEESNQSVLEYLGCRRSAPSFEKGMKMIRWGAQHDRGCIKALLND